MMDFEKLFSVEDIGEDMTVVEQQDLAGMLRGLLQSREWDWIKKQLEVGMRTSFQEITRSRATGDGAITLTRAQGAYLVLERLFHMPEATLSLLLKIDEARNGAVVEGESEKES